MSAHQRVRRNASPASGATTKQGPMKAILPVSLMRQTNSPTRNSQKNNVKASSPTTTWIVDASSRVKSSNRRSPDSRKSPERRNQGSPFYKEKYRTLNTRSNSSNNKSSSPVIRRTASLDAIYLSGHWPRDAFNSYCGHLMVDKSTQTPNEWEEQEKKKSPQKKLPSNSDYQLEKYIRQRLQRTKEAAVATHSHHHNHLHHPHHYSLTSPVQGDHSAISVNSTITTSEAATNTAHRAAPIPIPPTSKPLIPRMRSSVEGLNQEIEKLVLKGVTCNDDECSVERMREPTPDGHRAPIADLFLSNQPSFVADSATNTSPLSGTSHTDAESQTFWSPTLSRVNNDSNGFALEESGGSSTNSSGAGSRCQSVSPIVPIIPGLACTGLDNSRPSSQSELINAPAGKEKSTIRSISKSASPDSDISTQTKLGTSPHINKFLEREPPDGCEKIYVEETRQNAKSPAFCPLKPSMNFVLKPSLGSAFCPLEKTHLSKKADKENSSHVTVNPT